MGLRDAETRTGRQPRRASELVIRSDDGSENSPDTLARQAQRLRLRFGLTWPTARAVASLAFGEGAR